jgi:hypothetical protein
MPKYRFQEETVSKTLRKYVRASAIAFYNPLNANPYVGISEEFVEVDSDGNNMRSLDESVRDAGIAPINFEFTPEKISDTMDIIDPTNGNVLSSMSYGEVYSIIYSLYWHLAQLRDSDQG